MVLIDIEMPEACINCRCREHFGVFNRCQVLDIVLDDVHYRPVWCPLKEVQE